MRILGLKYVQENGEGERLLRRYGPEGGKKRPRRTFERKKAEPHRRKLYRQRKNIIQSEE